MQTLKLERRGQVLMTANRQPAPGFAEAAFRAITTLVFVAPDAILPKIMEQIKSDLRPEAIQSLTDDDLAIWETPEGQTYVNGKHSVYSLQF